MLHRHMKNMVPPFFTKIGNIGFPWFWRVTLSKVVFMLVNTCIVTVA